MKLLDDLQEWVDDLNALKSEKAKDEGRYESAMEDLEEAGFSSIEEGKAEAEKLKKRREELEEEASQLLEELKEKYAEFIKV